MAKIRQRYFPKREETNLIIRKGIQVHQELGHGFLEIVYKDALEFEFKKSGIIYDREREYIIEYKGTILPHRFYADFVVFDSVILEIKAKDRIASEDMAQTLNYLRCSGCKVGLVLNFGKIRLDIRRELYFSTYNSVNSVPPWQKII